MQKVKRMAAKIIASILNMGLYRSEERRVDYNNYRIFSWKYEKKNRKNKKDVFMSFRS